MNILSVSTRERLLFLMLDIIAVEPNTPVSLSDLAHTLGVSRERVRVLYRQLAREYPLPPVKNKGSWSKEMRRKHTVRKQIKETAVREKVKALRDKGFYFQQIIQDHGIPESQLWQATKQLSREGKTSRKLTSPETLAFEAVVRAYRAQGMTGDEIAQKTGKHRTTVYAALRRLDVPLSKRTRRVKGEKVTPLPRSYKKASLPRGRSPRSPQLTKAHLLQILQTSFSTQPKTSVSLSEIARALGVPRQRVHTLYHQFALDYPLPPVAKPGFGQLDQQTRLAIAKLGGEAVHAKGTAHRLTKEEGKYGVQNSLLKRARKTKA